MVGHLPPLKLWGGGKQIYYILITKLELIIEELFLYPEYWEYGKNSLKRLRRTSVRQISASPPLEK
jgi:hypothetical protein